MSDESPDSDAKSSKKKGSKSKGHKPSKSKSTEDRSIQRSAPEPAEPVAQVARVTPVSAEPSLADSGSPTTLPVTTEAVQGPPDAESSTPEPTDTEQPEPEPEPAVAEPVVTEPVVAEPVITEPVITEPVVTEPAVTEPVVTEPAASVAAATEPAAPEAKSAPSASEPKPSAHVVDTLPMVDPDVVPPGWPEPAPRFVVSNIVTIILGVIAVGLVVALVLTLLQLSDKNSLENARTSALSAARTYSIELSSYSYQHLNHDFATVESHSTPSFKKSFSQSSDALESTLVKFKASSTATLLGSGVVSASTSRVVALIFLSQTVTNSTQKQPSTDRSQIQMTLVNSGGQWLIDAVTLL
jgi:Mce-associated membrane protein